MAHYDPWFEHLLQPSTRLECMAQLTGYQRLEASHSIDRRREPWHIIILVSTDSLPGTIAGQEVTLLPGQLLWLPPQADNGFTWSTDLVYHTCWFRLNPEPDLGLTPMVVDQAQIVRAMIEELANELSQRASHSAILQKALVARICAHALRCGEVLNVGPGLSFAQRQACEFFVANHLGHGVDGRDLAQHLGLGHDWFSRIFKRTYGISPRSWMVQERMRHAAELLRQGDLSIAAVAELVSCHSASLFHRQFKAVHGMGPQAWLEQQGRTVHQH